MVVVFTLEGKLGRDKKISFLEKLMVVRRSDQCSYVF